MRGEHCGTEPPAQLASHFSTTSARVPGLLIGYRRRGADLLAEVPRDKAVWRDLAEIKQTRPRRAVWSLPGGRGPPPRATPTPPRATPTPPRGTPTPPRATPTPPRGRRPARCSPSAGARAGRPRVRGPGVSALQPELAPTPAQATERTKAWFSGVPGTRAPLGKVLAKLGFCALARFPLPTDPFADATKGDDLLPAGTEDYIHIRIQQRNGRKTLTTVQGIADDYDKKKLVKAFKKKFACNGTVIEHPEYGEVIQLQGDQRKNICQFLLEVGIVKEEQLKVHGF
ncbi:PREDICTED: eukaryotic translation initiation factor 1b [Dipodomys ordii]|uniref:Eukaryotic translation initiation factor 1b n=1 Tax=Dipodomys ordii TaxID=10020 RepID=A0A1S3GCF4_DIPOR|nr:PREDICTED: eukaryotic translation initiation factor 1b [Dipodomys ordii]